MYSLIHTEKQGIFERVIRSRTGQCLRVQFEVIDVGGQLHARIISAVPVLELNASKNNVRSPFSSPLCLPISSSKTSTNTEYRPGYVPFVSPYSELFFFTSQPTRAPSYQ